MDPAGLVIRSGGQTGVDRAALDCAILRGVPYTGWCPRGGWAEDFPAPPGVLERYPDLNQTPSADPDQRTAWNVRDSDATLIVIGRGGLDASRGTKMTFTLAKAIFSRPYHLTGVQHDGVKSAAAWLTRLVEAHASVGKPLVLNVAGPRESESPGVYAEAIEFIGRILDLAGE